jgi:hypothetical protein
MISVPLGAFLIFPLIGIYVGIRALSEIRKDQNLTGRWMAITGLALTSIGLLFGIAMDYANYFEMYAKPCSFHQKQVKEHLKELYETQLSIQKKHGHFAKSSEEFRDLTGIFPNAPSLYVIFFSPPTKPVYGGRGNKELTLPLGVDAFVKEHEFQIVVVGRLSNRRPDLSDAIQLLLLRKYPTFLDAWTVNEKGTITNVLSECPPDERL